MTNFVNATVKNNSACYWHISVPLYTWTLGTYIGIEVLASKNSSLYMFGGNSRTNASINITKYNTSLVTGEVYFLDATSDVMLVLVPSP